jgi:FG-GAP-like repeat/Bacterial Ig-like domain
MPQALASLTFAGALLAAPCFAQVPHVVEVTPAANSIGASTLAPITVRFDTTIDPTSLSSQSIRLRGSWSGFHDGSVTWVDANRIRFTPSTPLFAGEQAQVDLDPNLKSWGGQPLGRPYGYSYWVEALPAPLVWSGKTLLPTGAPGEAPRPYGAHGADLDRDGAPDLTVQCEVTGDLRVFKNDGKGNFPTPPTIHPMGGIPSPACADDFNADGWLDFAVAGYTGQISVFLNDGAGGLLAPTDFLVDPSPSGITTVDYDSDGDADIVAPGSSFNTLTRLLNNGNGTFVQAAPVPSPANLPTAIATGDVDGDGLMDLIVAGDAEMVFMRNNGAGGFAPKPGGSLALESVIRQITMCDMNDDGFLDAAMGALNGKVVVGYGNGQGAITSQQSLLITTYISAFDAADLDGDNDLDWITSNFVEGNWSIIENQGIGLFREVAKLDAVSNPGCSLVLDLQGDGRNDIVGIDEISDDLVIFKNAAPAVQGFSKSAGLRVNGSVGTPGFGLQPPVSVPTGTSVQMEVLGHGSSPYGVFVSALGAQSALPLGTLGTLNLELGTTLKVALGVMPPAANPSDVRSLQTLSYLLSTSVPVGTHFALQGFAVHPGLPKAPVLLTNPVEFQVTP